MRHHNVSGFDWNHGNLQKCQKHGVDIAEIESAFRQTIAVFPDPSHSQGEQRFIGIGKTQQGRSLFIAFTLRSQSGEDLIRRISARYMHQKEVDHYEKTIAKA